MHRCLRAYTVGALLLAGVLLLQAAPAAHAWYFFQPHYWANDAQTTSLYYDDSFTTYGDMAYAAEKARSDWNQYVFAYGAGFYFDRTYDSNSLSRMTTGLAAGQPCDSGIRAVTDYTFGAFPSITGASVTLNTHCGWGYWGGRTPNFLPSNWTDARTLFSHEFGHVLLLCHQFSGNSLMGALPIGQRISIDWDSAFGDLALYPRTNHYYYTAQTGCP